MAVAAADLPEPDAGLRRLVRIRTGLLRTGACLMPIRRGRRELAPGRGNPQRGDANPQGLAGIRTGVPPIRMAALRIRGGVMPTRRGQCEPVLARREFAGG